MNAYNPKRKKCPIHGEMSGARLRTMTRKWVLKKGLNEKGRKT